MFYRGPRQEPSPRFFARPPHQISSRGLDLDKTPEERGNLAGLRIERSFVIAKNQRRSKAPHEYLDTAQDLRQSRRNRKVRAEFDDSRGALSFSQFASWVGAL